MKKEKINYWFSSLTGTFSLVLLISFPIFTTAQTSATDGFSVTGMGGAGGMYTPASSPYNKDLLLVSCDMSGSYRSLDGGKSWQMIHSEQLNSSRTCRPIFIGDSIFWISGGQLRYSIDKGENWKAITGGKTSLNNDVTALAYSSGNPAAVFAGAAGEVYVSKNGGSTWDLGVKGNGKVYGISTLGANIFAAIGQQLWKSTDNGTNWSALSFPDSNNEMITSIASELKNDNHIIYAVVSKIGLFRSTDNGESWQNVLKIGDITTDSTTVVTELTDVLIPSNQLTVAYANNSHQLFKTEDGGNTWKSIFRMDIHANPSKSILPFNVEDSWVQTELKWGYYITELGLGINYNDPDIAIVTTQGDIYITRDGGGSWKQIMNEKIGVLPGDPGIRYRSIGLEVTSSWNYYFDPFDNNRQFIAYTDIGFARTVDQGETWIYSAFGSGSWRNTYYNVEFDHEVKGMMFASAGNRHDIPHWTHISPNTAQHEGGVVISPNSGINWLRRNTGLPKAPCTWVALDPASPNGKRTLYAAMYGEGVYKSVDGGDTWTRKSNGLGNRGNMHVLQLHIHPKTGTLYASITARREGSIFAVPGGLWKSTDGGENWSDISASLALKWPTYFAVHPEDPEIIYLSAATAPGAPQGGVYKTTNGGTTWKRLLKDEDFAKRTTPTYVHAMGVKIHPDYHDIVYLGTASHGLWVSADAGNNWGWFDRLPFKGAQNVTFNPSDTRKMVVNTFGGGVWKGYFLPDGYVEPPKVNTPIYDKSFRFEVYPNPNTGSFTVSLDGVKGNAKLEIFSISGVKVLEKNVETTNQKASAIIELNRYKHNGILYLRLTSSDISYTKPIIIQ